MSEWQGLHNPERHITTTSGKRAMCANEGMHNHDTWCDPENLCYCCLAAEVERLRAAMTNHICTRNKEPQCSCCYEVVALDEYAKKASAAFQRLDSLRGRLVFHPCGTDARSFHLGLTRAWELIQEALDGAL